MRFFLRIAPRFAAVVLVGVWLPLAYAGCSGDFVATADGSVDPPEVEAGSDASAAADVFEAGVDGPLPDAGLGDPRLDRAPQTSCYSALDAGIVSGAFPGYAYDLFKGKRADGMPVSNVVGNLYHCPTNGLLRLQLSYEGPTATDNPSLGLKREGVPSTFAVEYVLESSQIPQETADDILVGPFAASSSPSGLLVLAVARRAPSEVLEVVRVTLTDTRTFDLGVFTYPVRLRLETVAMGANTVEWTVTAQDRATRVVRKGTDMKPDAPFALLFGTTRKAPSAPNSAVFSEVKLP